MLKEAFTSCAIIANESFKTSQDTFTDVNRNKLTVAVITLLLVFLLLVLVLIFGKFLWNKVACKYITIFKPINTVIELLAIMVLLDLILPGCNCVHI